MITQAGALEELIQLTPTETLERLAALLANGNIWHLPRLYRRLGAAALEDGLITPEGHVTEKGYMIAAGYEGPTADQRLIVGGSDESLPGPFATPNVKA